MNAMKLVVLLSLLGTSGCVLRGAPISPYGRQAQVQPKSGHMNRGELIAATPDTIWIYTVGGLRPYSTAELRQVNVERHRFGLGRTMRWMGWTGLATGAALMISCTSYANSSEGSGSSSDCFGVIPGTVLFFGLAGALFGAINDYSSKYHLRPTETGRLQPLSRFPQGMNDSARVQLLRPATP